MKKKTSRYFVKSGIGKCLLLAICLTQAGRMTGQQNYDNFDGNRVLRYGERSGVLDSAATNPMVNGVNGSAKCGLYVRNGARKFANIKMNLPAPLTGVEQFATYEGVPPQLQMKVYTSAPAGTLVEILLGTKRGNNDYPAGTHSQYQAYTTKSNEWETLEFKFSQIPQGSETAVNQIDQIVLLFNPNSSTSDSYYFDDLTGPSLSAMGEAPANPDKQGTGPGKPNKKSKPMTKKGNTDKKAK